MDDQRSLAADRLDRPNRAIAERGPGGEKTAEEQKADAFFFLAQLRLCHEKDSSQLGFKDSNLFQDLFRRFPNPFPIFLV
jgi:hypothetical protein